jgi:PAS domain S-box-containing protein
MRSVSLRAAAEQLQELLRSGDDPITTRVHVALRRLPVAALAADDRAHSVAANDAALRLTGYAEQELLRLAVPDITATSDQPHTQFLWRAFIAEGARSGTYDIRRKDGTTITVDYLAIANAAPGIHVSLLLPVPR